MNHPIVADESVDYAIVPSLRKIGFDVSAICETHAGWPDWQVLEFAFQENAYLITEDKDFGERTFRLFKPSHGILLIRMPNAESEEKAAWFWRFLGMISTDFGKTFLF